MLSDYDGDSKHQPQGLGTFMRISAYYILLSRISIPSKIIFHWSHLRLELSQTFLL